MLPAESASPKAPIVHIQGLRKSYGANEVLKGIDLQVQPGEVIAIIGKSGSGKSTLLRCINGLEVFQSGSLTVDSKPLLHDNPAAMRELGNEHRREMGRHAYNRAENSHLPFRRRERAMQRFRRMKSLQKFASVHGSIYNHFNQERHLVDRQTYKLRRSAALAEWQNLMA